MPGMLDHMHGSLRRQLSGRAHRTRIHQPVATAGQPQARHRQLRQLAAQVRHLQQFQAIGKHVRSRLAAGQQAIAHGAHLVLRMIRAEGFQRDEVFERAAVIGAQPVGEIAEDIRRHRVRPWIAGHVAAHETRTRAEHHQARDTAGIARRGVQRDQAAERPAAPRGHGHVFSDRRCAFRQRQRHRRIAAQAVARQVDHVQRVAIAQSRHQRREHTAVHRPAVQQYQRRPLADHLDMQVAHRAAILRRRRPCTPTARGGGHGDAASCALCRGVRVGSDDVPGPCEYIEQAIDIRIGMSRTQRDAQARAAIGDGRWADRGDPVPARLQRARQRHRARVVAAQQRLDRRVRWQQRQSAARGAFAEPCDQSSQLVASPVIACAPASPPPAPRRPAPAASPSCRDTGARSASGARSARHCRRQTRRARRAPCPASPSAPAPRAAPSSRGGDAAGAVRPEHAEAMRIVDHQRGLLRACTSASSRSGATSPSMLNTPSVASSAAASGTAAQLPAARLDIAVRIALAARSRPGVRRRSGWRG